MPIGPVQLLVVRFDEPNFTGEVIEELTRLRESNVIRLIDALAVQKSLDGDLIAVQWSDLSIDEAEGLGASSVRSSMGTPVRKAWRPVR